MIITIMFKDLEIEIHDRIDNDICEAKGFQEFFTEENKREIISVNREKKFFEWKEVQQAKEEFRQAIRNWKDREADNLLITENQIEHLLDKYIDLGLESSNNN